MTAPEPPGAGAGVEGGADAGTDAGVRTSEQFGSPERPVRWPPIHGAGIDRRPGGDALWLALWAPRATRVDALVRTDGDVAPLTRWAAGAAVVPLRPDPAAGPGWWSRRLPLDDLRRRTGGSATQRAEALDPTTTTGPELDYAFVVDRGPARPDPRSACQPAGVHGPSRLVDHERYRWHDHGWSAPPLASGVLYELHLGTFSAAGTARAAIEHLDHLVDLGVTHIELLPVATFAGRHGWGYDGVDLFAPHPAYGTPDDLRALVDACHGRGLAVLLDVVYNHFGPEGAYAPKLAPYVLEGPATPWGAAVNLDGPDSDEVRRFLLDNAHHWIVHHHVDGLRLDAVHAFVDRSARPFVEELAASVRALERQLGRRLVLVAEDDRQDSRLLLPPEVGGAGLDAAWVDDLHHALHAALTGERHGYYAGFGGLAAVADALEHGYVTRGRHAVERGHRHGRPGPAPDGGRLVVCSQNHDQVGNRPAGERLAHLAGVGAAAVAAATVLLSPFVPMLFQGEEWATSSRFPYLADHGDPDLVAAVRRGRQDEFASFTWDPAAVADPEDPATFAMAVLRWDELDEPGHAWVLDWYRSLIGLRRRHPDLVAGPTRDALAWAGSPLVPDVRVDEEAGTLLLRRHRVLLAAVLGDVGATICLPPAPGGPDARWVPYRCSDPDWSDTSLGTGSLAAVEEQMVELPGWCALVLLARQGPVGVPIGSSGGP